MMFSLFQPQAVAAVSVVYSNNPWLKGEGTFYVCGPCAWCCAPVTARKGDGSGRPMVPGTARIPLENYLLLQSN